MVLFADVDRVVLSVDRNAALTKKKDGPQNILIMYSSREGQDFTKYTPLGEINQRDRSKRLIVNLNEWGLDFSQYHNPIVQEYHVANDYVGSIVLLSMRERLPISLKTIATLAKLRPFVTYMFSNCIFRNRVKYPESLIVGELVSEMNSTPKYSEQDTSVLTLLLYGYSYKEAAASLDISIDTVKKHVKKVYSREKVGSLAELWAKYVTLQPSNRSLFKDTQNKSTSLGKGTQQGTTPDPPSTLSLP